MSAIPSRQPAYRPCEMPHRLGIGKTKFHELVKTPGFPKPSVLGPRAKVWTEEQVEELLRVLRGE